MITLTTFAGIMKIANHINKKSHTITFKRWSRKKDAFLSTMGMTINIASIAISIIEKLDCKKNRLNFIENSIIAFSFDKKEENEDLRPKENCIHIPYSLNIECAPSAVYDFKYIIKKVCHTICTDLFYFVNQTKQCYENNQYI